jgi:pyruvate dehydrogenase E2 component (dihydrolipoamide acetyltransferase)
VKKIRMPNAGQTTDSATIIQWSVNLRDAVHRGTVLVEVETDKAILPVESYAEGYVAAIHFSEGDVVQEGDILVTLADDLTELEKYQNHDKNSEKEKITHDDLCKSSNDNVGLQGEETIQDTWYPILPTSRESFSAVEKTTAQSFPAMPNAKQFSKIKGFSIDRAIPSNGKYIKLSDVEREYELATISSDGQTNDLYSVIELTAMRSVIGSRLLKSVQTTPMFGLNIKVDMSAAFRLREICLRSRGYKLPINVLLARVLSIAAKEHPLLNARFESNEIRVNKNANIGIAVSTDDGLLVPVLSKVDETSMKEVALQYEKIVENARIGRVNTTNKDLPSTTISSLGSFGIEEFNAIINPPECSIFAVGAATHKPCWNGKTFEPVLTMSITGTFDHRVFDGATAALAMGRIKELLENPETSLL